MIPRGGRGRKTPYPTKPVRIPEPLIDRVYDLIIEFHSQGDVSDDEPPVADSSYPIPVNSAIRQAQTILRSKKGNKQQQVAKLLQLIYGVEIVEESGTLKLLGSAEEQPRANA